MSSSFFTQTKHLKQILTPRQFETARLIAQGMTVKEVAEMMKISRFMVKQYLVHIYERIGVSGQGARIELATRFAVEEERGLYRQGSHR